MRHIYFRLIVGVVWILVGVVQLLMAFEPFGFVYLMVGAAFLYSAYTLNKKRKGE